MLMLRYQINFSIKILTLAKFKIVGDSERKCGNFSTSTLMVYFLLLLFFWRLHIFSTRILEIGGKKVNRQIYPVTEPEIKGGSERKRCPLSARFEMQ